MLGMEKELLMNVCADDINEKLIDLLKRCYESFSMITMSRGERLESELEQLVREYRILRIQVREMHGQMRDVISMVDRVVGNLNALGELMNQV